MWMMELAPVFKGPLAMEFRTFLKTAKTTSRAFAQEVPEALFSAPYTYDLQVECAFLPGPDSERPDALTPASLALDSGNTVRLNLHHAEDGTLIPSSSSSAVSSRTSALSGQTLFHLEPAPDIEGYRGTAR